MSENKTSVAPAQLGAKTIMTNVISLASRRAAISVQSSAQVPAFKPAPASPAPASDTYTVERQQAIENALSTALYFIRLPYSTTALKGATGRANRALTLLKQACTEAKTIEGRA